MVVTVVDNLLQDSEGKALVDIVVAGSNPVDKEPVGRVLVGKAAVDIREVVVANQKGDTAALGSHQAADKL